MRERGRRPGRIERGSDAPRRQGVRISTCQPIVRFGCAPSAVPHRSVQDRRQIRIPCAAVREQNAASKCTCCHSICGTDESTHPMPHNAQNVARIGARKAKKKTLRPDLPGEAFSGPMFGPALDAAAAAVPPLPTWASGRPRNSGTHGRTARHSRRTESWPPKTLWNISSSSTACIPSGFG